MSAAWLESLRVRLFADGADTAGILELARLPFVAGFTTNPTLMRRAGVADYRAFAREVLSAVPERPVSFEVIADEFDAMARQAREIAGWGPNVFVKVPVTNTRGEPALDLLRRLAREGVRLNVTALMTLDQVRAAADALAGGPPCFVSVFAGRVADTGRDPLPLMAEAVEILRPHPQQRLIWASPREVLNVVQADAVGCHVITATSDLIRKLPLVGRDLAAYSLETVREFQADARNAGYEL